MRRSKAELVDEKMSLLSPTQDNPEAYARALLAHLNLRRVGDINSFAALLGLTIKEVDSDAFEGVLLRSPNELKGIIAVKRSIREEGRKRFTICHEIGHFILPGHGASECICKAEEVESWRKSVPEQEIAANRFAAELLLPYKEVAPLVNRKTATIALAQDISAEFGSSLTAASLKCVEVTEERCAFVYSLNGVIKWYRANDSFKYHIRVNQKLSEVTYAGRLLSNPSVDETDGAVPAEAWLQNEGLLPDVRIWEDSILLPFYNSILTILTIHRQIE